MRWPEGEPQPEALFQQAGVDAAVGAALPEGLPAAVDKGLYPGIKTPGQRVDWVEEVGSASREPWIDSNAWLVSYQRAMEPGKPVLLGYQPNEAAGVTADRMVPFESLEIGLMEARAMGGNWIVAPDERFRRQLAANDAAAVEAWKKFGVFAAWLKANRSLFGHPMYATITAMVDAGMSQEYANLLFRRGASPRLVRAADLPAPSGECLCMVAAGIKKPEPALAAKLLAHAKAGAFLVVDARGESAWWRQTALKPVKEQADRTFHSFGKGTIVAYTKAIANPSEFALDVIDLATYRNRPIRVWGAGTVVYTASRRGPESIATLMNYGRSKMYDVQLRIRGHYKTAVLHTPEEGPKTLEARGRESMTEVFLPELGRMGVVVFS
ncbi:MAG: hypothetical protein ABI972_14310 [Acidobacteriota bacterium]